MATTATEVSRIFKEVRQLPATAQWELIEELVRNLRDATEASAEPLLDIRGLCGLGKEHWEGIDPQVYIDAERDSWE